jgi:hypothetical protein
MKPSQAIPSHKIAAGLSSASGCGRYRTKRRVLSRALTNNDDWVNVVGDAVLGRRARYAGGEPDAARPEAPSLDCSFDLVVVGDVVHARELLDFDARKLPRALDDP